MTTAYVVDYLSTKHAVCAYFGKRDTSKASLGGVYRSLIWQLLQRQQDLQLQYCDWYDQEKKKDIVDPTSNDGSLEQFLRLAVTVSKSRLFIVLDGLDEYSVNHQERLLQLFDQASDAGGLLKVFVSCRHGDSERRLLPGSTKVEILISHEKDRQITRFLCRDNSGISREIRDQVIDEISTKAKGSAIWIDLALKYISGSYITNQIGLQEAMDELPSSEGLAELYSKLFDQACRNIRSNKKLLQRCLETLAVAHRPLTLSELSWAVFMDPENEDVTTVSKLGGLVRSKNIRDLIQPFVKLIKNGGDNLDEVHLLHQSIATLIALAPPGEWTGERLTNEAHNTLRLAELNAALLKRCMKYLLLDECGEKDIMAPHEDATTLSELPGFFEDEPVEDDNDKTSAPDFDPSTEGFGGFYSYAASFWTSHLSSVSDDLRPATDDIVALCRPEPFRRQNWLEQWKRPKCTYRQERQFPISLGNADALVVTALFGPSAALADLLRRDLATPSSLWEAVGYVIDRDQIESLTTMANSEVGSEVLCVELLFSIAHRLGTRTLQGKTKRDWQSFIDMALHKLQSELLVDGNGNDLLCHAARTGCLLLIERLFAVASAELRKVMLAGTRAYGPIWISRIGHPNENIDHQSVGEAVFNGHGDIVDFLCQQPGIEAHVRFKSPSNATTFHRAERRPRLRIYKSLFRMWPEGLSLLDSFEDTALGLLLYDHTSSHEFVLECVRFMLGTGVIDTNGFVATSGELRIPLHYTTSKYDIKLSLVLVREGSADPYRVLEIDDTCRPLLKYVKRPHVDPINPGPGEREREKQDETIKALCRQCPLTISMDYLV